MLSNIRHIVLIICLVAVAVIAKAQGGNEFTILLSDPAKRGKLKAHLNSGSITVKGTARKDVLVKYASEKDDDDNDHRHDGNRGGSRDGLKRIGGGGMELEASENSNVLTATSDMRPNSPGVNPPSSSGTALTGTIASTL